MKKLVVLVCLLAIGLFIGEVFALNAARMQGGNPDNWYIEVEYNQGALTGAAASVSHGDCLEWDLDSDTGETLGYTVHKCDAADAENVAGVVPGNSDSMSFGKAIVDGDVFMMQIRGYHEAVACDGNVAAGQSLASEANGCLGDGDGVGFAFEDDAADTTNSNTGYSAEVWIDFDR